MSKQELMLVYNFILFQWKVFEIKFLKPVDLTNTDLDSIVTL